ncbi:MULTISPECIES: helix-turn-helix domain-containing protein [unclassified Variovorax]|uniref:helix-turn-helix domain-containing protein n=1 Tax=unclassified Variovorax TaxID=663243 RepID=UPI00139224BA|nr:MULTISPECIES: helix-turn-helix domain-containing protein [unclassified Variovorax]
MEAAARMRNHALELRAAVGQRASRAFLAEASLTSYHCDAVCRSAWELLAFPIRQLREAIDGDQGTPWAWIESLGLQSRRQRARIKRLMHLLLTEGQDGSYDRPGTRMELAAELGVTAEALYRALPSLQKKGILSVQGSRLSWRG